MSDHPRPVTALDAIRAHIADCRTRWQPISEDSIGVTYGEYRNHDEHCNACLPLITLLNLLDASTAALAKAIRQGCTCDHLYGATCNIHRLATPAGVQEAVDHLKALEDAVRFVKQFLLKLEGPEEFDPLRAIRQRTHKPLHAKLDAALKGALTTVQIRSDQFPITGETQDPKACQCAFTDAWRCAVDQRLTGQIACHCDCHTSRLTKALKRGVPNV